MQFKPPNMNRNETVYNEVKKFTDKMATLDPAPQFALPNLMSGNDWLEYMIANGWTLSEAVTGDEIDHVLLTRGTPRKDREPLSERLEYYNSYKNNTSFVHYQRLAGKWTEVTTLRGIDLEADLGRFMFTAHGMGWVDFPKALKKIGL